MLEEPDGAGIVVPDSGQAAVAYEFTVERAILVDHEPDDPVRAWQPIREVEAEYESDALDQVLDTTAPGLRAGRYRVLPAFGSPMEFVVEERMVCDVEVVPREKRVALARVPVEQLR